jgi:uncharacterized protein (TIGR02246 family)
MDPKNIVAPVIERLESAWNAADGAAYAAPFTPDADFVNIRGELHSGADNIGAGHQGIFNSIYKGSTVDYSVVKARELRDGEILAHVTGKLHVPEGPLAGDQRGDRHRRAGPRRRRAPHRGVPQHARGGLAGLRSGGCPTACISPSPTRPMH